MFTPKNKRFRGFVVFFWKFTGLHREFPGLLCFSILFLYSTNLSNFKEFLKEIKGERGDLRVLREGFKGFL